MKINSHIIHTCTSFFAKNPCLPTGRPYYQRYTTFSCYHTTIPVATISANAAVQNIIIFEFSLFVVNRSVANCVLSPSSANKTVVNIVRNILKVILSIFSSHNGCHHRREWSAAEFPSVCMALLGLLLLMPSRSQIVFHSEVSVGFNSLNILLDCLSPAIALTAS